MAENKQSFILYRDLIHTVRKLSNEQAGELFKHILAYVNDENPVTENVIIDLVFEPIKQGLKRDLKKYERVVERNKSNGSKGGRPRKPKKPTGLNNNPNNPSEPKKADSDIDSDNDIVISKDISIKKENIDINYLPVIQKWITYKKKIKNNYKTIEGFNAFYNELIKLSRGDLILADSIIQQSINKEWKGIFELKTDIKIKRNGNRHSSVQAEFGERRGSSTI